MSDSPRCLQAGCHCGAVRFELLLPTGKPEVRRCNCSLCRRKGAAMLTVKVGDLRILRGSELLTLYRWNTGIARHYFCRQCGIYTHHQRRSDPLQIGVNVGCLEGVDLAEFETAQVRNGMLDP